MWADCAAFGLEKNDASPTACFDLASLPAWRAKQRYLDNVRFDAD